MKEELEKISGGIPEISIPKPEVRKENLSIENEITRLEAMHVLGQINLGDEQSSFSKIYIDLLEEYEKKYGELPKEPFVRDEKSAKEILSPSRPSEKIISSEANTPSPAVEGRSIKTSPKVSPLSLFEEPLNI